MKWSEPDIGQDEINAVNEAISEGWISGFGPRVKEFERAVEKKLNVKHAIAVCNGTCGLIALFQSIKNLLGRPIIIGVPTWTFFATASAANFVGKVELVDIRLRNFNMNAMRVPLNVDIICPVDCGGAPADYDWLKELDLPIVADSCEAFGAKYNGKRLGSIADAHVFSFYATKIITTGEGGMITTNKDYIANMVRSIINLGYTDTINYTHNIFGFNFRMPELQAAIGLVQLKKLDKYIKHRNNLAKIYKEELTGIVPSQDIAKRETSAYYLFTIVFNEPKIRDRVLTELSRNDIPTRRWTPMHMQTPYMGQTKKFPVADWLYSRHIHLPIHNLLGEEQVKSICQIIRKIAK